MKTKICKRCGKRKKLSSFSKNKSKKDGLHYYCKKCINTYYLNNKKRFKKRIKLYYQKNKEHLLKYRKKYYINNKIKTITQVKKYRAKRKNKFKKYQRIYRKRTKKKLSLYLKNKRKNDLNFKLKTDLRTRIRQAIKYNWRFKHSYELLGCSIEELKQYLESKFKLGMSWKNYGRKKGIKCWEIDHIKPCASFDLSKLDEQYKCFNYTNLQPLWAKENRKKGNSNLGGK